MNARDNDGSRDVKFIKSVMSNPDLSHLDFIGASATFAGLYISLMITDVMFLSKDFSGEYSADSLHSF